MKNHYYILKSGKKSVLAFLQFGINGMVEQVEKRNAYGIKPRNAEQAFAIHAVLKARNKISFNAGRSRNR
jgi:PhoH-like ATPase